MFDIGFWEIVVVAVVALIVVGPEKFPGLIRGIGYWFGRFRRLANNVKNEFQVEMEKAEQIKKLRLEQEDLLKKHLDLEQFDQPTVSVKGKTAGENTPAPTTPSTEPVTTPHVAKAEEKPKP